MKTSNLVCTDYEWFYLLLFIVVGRKIGRYMFETRIRDEHNYIVHEGSRSKKNKDRLLFSTKTSSYM